MNTENIRARQFLQTLCVVAATSIFLTTVAKAQDVTVNIVNGRTTPVDVFWVDETGTETPYANLPVGASYDQPSYPGHKWHFRANGQLVFQYTVQNAPAQQVIVRAMAAPNPQPQPRPAITTPLPIQNNGGLQAPINFSRPDINAINQAILAETNRQRANNRLPALQLSPQLNNAAQMHANDMVSQNFFSHTNPNDRSKASMEQRVQLSGFVARSMAENIATSFGIQYVANTPVYTGGPGVFMAQSGGPQIPAHTPASFATVVVKQWMDSPGHRRNILSQNTFLGVGVTFYPDQGFNGMMTGKAVQVFGSN